MNFAHSNLNDRITRAEKVETRHEIRLNHLRQDVDNLDKNAAENLDRIFALEYVIGKIKRDGIRPSEDILIDDDDEPADANSSSVYPDNDVKVTRRDSKLSVRDSVGTDGLGVSLSSSILRSTAETPLSVHRKDIEKDDRKGLTYSEAERAGTGRARPRIRYSDKEEVRDKQCSARDEEGDEDKKGTTAHYLSTLKKQAPMLSPRKMLTMLASPAPAVVQQGAEGFFQYPYLTFGTQTINLRSKTAIADMSLYKTTIPHSLLFREKFIKKQNDFLREELYMSISGTK